MPQRLFVYGTLRSGSGNPMHDRLAAKARFLGPALWSGRMFWSGAYPVAVDAHSGEIQGELYQISEPTIWTELDRYEGCLEGLFRREERWVRTGNGRRLRSWVYLFQRPIAGMRRIDDGDFLRWKATAVGDSAPGQASPGYALPNYPHSCGLDLGK